MTSCSSSVSAQKSAKSEPNSRSKSTETVCTSDSSCCLQKRKPANPLMYSLRPTYSKTSNSSIRQRVLSAKLLKLRTIQNQLNDANYHLTELAKENQILKNLQKRQDKALSKYESTNADLPRLLHAHEEQLRIVNEKNKNQKRTIRELNDLLKVKDEELSRTQEKLNHLEKLNRDKRLLDREKLLDQVEDLKLKLQKSDEQVAILNRKLMLESKTSKQRLNTEMMKHKQCQRELGQALSEIDKMTNLLETKENEAHPRRNRFTRIDTRQSVSMIALNSYHPNRTKSSEKLSTIVDTEPLPPKTPVTDIKLEPIKCKVDTSTKNNGIFDIPSKNIKNRLSSGSTKSRSSEENLLMGNGFSSGSEQSLNMQDNSSEGKSGSDLEKSRPNSGTKLAELTKNLDEAVQKATENANEDFDEKFADYCSTVTNNVTECSKRIEEHKESMEMYKNDTHVLLETFKKTQKLESKLRSSLLSSEHNDDLDFLSEIFSDDMKTRFRKDRNQNIENISNKGGPVVKLEDKKKLLATLKAIDNGDNFDNLADSSNMMHEMLKDVSQ